MTILFSLAFVLGSALIVEHVREKHHELSKKTLIDHLNRKRKENNDNAEKGN
jgi:hypothetical protein